MFYLNKEIELTADILRKMITRFNLNVAPKIKKYQDYYEGKQDILKKTYTDATKPCNRITTNYCRNIVNTYNGYLAKPGYISYSSEQDIEDILDILRYNDYNAADAAFLQDALICGVANELMYNDSEGHTRFRLINPRNSFGVYDDSLTGDLLYFVRFYEVSEWDDTNLYNVDVYTDTLIKHYQMSGLNGTLIFIGEEPHYFNQCPANVFVMPNEESIFDCILTLQDSYNTILSAEIDDYEAFVDAFLVLYGVDVDTEDVANMKENRVLAFPFENAKAEWLTKNINDAQVENILKRIQDNIYRISQCPDFSSENFVSGVSSGVAIRFKLSGIETRTAPVEAEFKKALQRRIELIAGVAALKMGEEVFRDIQITFKRNLPEDNASLANLVNSLKGTVSDKTLLSMLPFVSDVNAEYEAIQEQKQANMAMYSFGNTAEDTEDDI